ncbi:nucleoside triphosphate pyrophosphohydrolase [Aestuariispira insulae]|uniref:Nucleoside triphosphate pyrophosphohydrolase n=1 Tax=Aestuariispira insulae TaxID=1461337 RepID=A0A3D9HUX1_9PROT|nr:nucleoside triphosphate pyrophosphohydrolase [Aestuariispira insulae]RED53239.1 ATP diphosphatase [Aestuariispira insulae]
MTANIDRLIGIMAQLRNPEGGCPWDLEQDFSTIAPYTIEEAYEVADAIDRGDFDDLRDELGDLLLQVVFHARMAEEENLFAFDDVAGSIADKMIRRHPHVFSDHDADNPDAVRVSWEDTKARERAEKGLTKSALDGVAVNLPSLTRAEKLTKRAARVGFDWTEARDIFDKIEEEIGELQHEMDINAAHDRLEDELGDLLFCMANLARHLKIDPELALRRANNKFSRRFKEMEQEYKKQGEELKDQTLANMEAAWQSAKRRLAAND